VVIITQDFTERRQSLQEITILAQAVKSTSECISITDDKDILLFVNEAFCRTYGTHAGADRAPHRDGAVPLQPQQSVSDVLNKTLGKRLAGELLNRRKDGTDFPIFLSTAVVPTSVACRRR